jgi:hypothetical protein
MCILVVYLSTGQMTFTPTTPLNLSSADFELINKPTFCYGKFVSVIVSSAVDNVERRQVIRKTWASDHKVHFVIGRPTNDSLQMMIDREAAHYGDIIQSSFTDTYRNLTYKSVAGLAWFRDYCTSPFILKVDDDLYVNIKSVENFLKKGAKLQNGIYCQVARHAQVIRSPKSEYSKWLVTPQEYSGNFYPDYCLGSFGAMIGRTAISTLLDQVNNVPFFWLEDVYITGLLRERTSLRIMQIARNKLVSELSKFNVYNADSIYLGPVGVSAEDMLHLWQNITAVSTEI